MMSPHVSDPTSLSSTSSETSSPIGTYKNNNNEQVPLDTLYEDDSVFSLPSRSEQRLLSNGTPNTRNQSQGSGGNDFARRVQRVSKRAALAGKRKIWDTNDASIDAAQSAVDQWEHAYTSLRSFLISSTQSAMRVYDAAKTGAGGIEHHLLLPVRDFVVLPAFSVVETTASHTVEFLRSEQAAGLADATLDIARKTPFIGETFLAPSLVKGVQCLQTAWEIAQYPIPSKDAVRQSVDWAMTGTKGTIQAAGHELYYYTKLVDATITRTIMNTQWRVLGSGPYSTLDDANKLEVIDHLCERYLSLQSDPIARYELSAHIRSQNRRLYEDLVMSGLLTERGGQITKDDAWLSPHPAYRTRQNNGHFIDIFGSTMNYSNVVGGCSSFSPLWFFLPNQNGKRPGKDVPWVCFPENEIRKLEHGFRSFVQNGQEALKAERARSTSVEELILSVSAPFGDEESVTHLSVEDNEEGTLSAALLPPRSPPTLVEMGKLNFNKSTDHEENIIHENVDADESLPKNSPAEQIESVGIGVDRCANGNINANVQPTQYLTIAQWYEPDLLNDVLVDQRRHAVSFVGCCPHCKALHEQPQYEPLSPKSSSTVYGQLCDRCSDDRSKQYINQITAPFNHPVRMVMRPTFWRFYGHGNEVRRAIWLLDTKRFGLQPYSDESAAILEDAYFFLKWNLGEQRNDADGMLLTVQVSGPPYDDGEDQQQHLVQFQSLTKVTAIQKTIGGGLALFKRRVYRGADIKHLTISATNRHVDEVKETENDLVSVEDARSSRDSMETVLDNELDDALTIESVGAMSANHEKVEIVNPQESDYNSADSVMSLAAPKNLLLSSTAYNGILGYGDGGEEEEANHLVLVVHGIGEMMRKVDLFGLSLPYLSSIVDCCAWLRRNHAAVHAAQFPQQQQDDNGATMTRENDTNVGRVEYLAVEWHESFALQTLRTPAAHAVNTKDDSSSVTTLNDISLKTIPHLRSLANDTVLDILYFMSPRHHEIIIDIVVKELNFMVEKYRRITGFTGKISLVAHSLGSVIAWDILSHQSLNASVFPYASKTTTDNSPSNRSSSISSPSMVDEGRIDLSLHSISSPTKEYPQLTFDVVNTFMLGSPVAVFLMIRNQEHHQHQPQLLLEDMFLPGCSRIFNIFHPYDPAAYRMEPLVDRRNANVEPKIITHWKGGFRVQYQTRMLWKRLMDETRKTQKNIIAAVEKGIEGIGLLDMTVDDLLLDEEEDDHDGNSVTSTEGYEHDGDGYSNNVQIVRCGRLNEGRRIDYMLQEKEIENANEYVSALSAHSSYWNEKDLSLFIARQIFRSRDEARVKTAAVEVTGPVHGVSAKASFREAIGTHLLKEAGNDWFDLESIKIF